MSMKNSFTPVWEAPTTSDTVQFSRPYLGLGNPTAASVAIVYKSEAGGSDITLNLAAGAQWSGQVVLIKTTGTAAGILAAKAF